MAGTLDTPSAAPMVGRLWVWGVRVAAGLFLLFLGCVSIYLYITQDWCRRFPGEALGIVLVTLVPNGVILLRLGSAQTQTTRGLQQGLAWTVAAAWISSSFCLIGLLSPAMTHAETERKALLSRGFVLAELTQVVLVGNAIMAYRTTVRQAADWRKLAVGFRVGLILFVAILLVSTPFILRFPDYWPSAGAVGALRIINTAQITYASTYPERGFATSLQQLGPPDSGQAVGPEAADLIDPMLVSGRKNCYQFVFIPGKPDEKGRVRSYSASVQPYKYGYPSQWSFFTDESGVIRSTSEDRPATAQDQPIS